MNSRGFYIALEQRVLLDAAGVATAVETLPDHIDTAAAATEDAQEQEAIQGLLNAFAEQPADSTSNSVSLIFVDSRVENPEQLLGNSLDKSAEIYTIEQGVDGLAYIAEILGQQEGKVSSLHIISHGSSGELLLGSKHITTESLSGDDGQYLAMMSERLNNEADILFYGCNVAEGEDGKRFVEKFALITGADIAASTDLTGSIALGGDADLEYTTGNIEAQPVIELASLANYSELLGTPDAGGNVTLTNLSGAITEDSAAPGAANVRLTPTTLNDGADPDPTEVRVISVTGGTLTQTDGSAIVLGAAGTKLSLTGSNYDFRFTPDANRDTDVTFSYVVVESGGELNSSASTATISITAANDAPTASNVSLPNVDEDTSAPTGTAISTLFSGNFSDVDTGSSLGGILVVSNSADLLTQGNWQYSSDGTNFFDIGAVADDGTALALSASTQLRFVPAADYNGAPPALTVRAVDDTQAQYSSGGSRVTVDSSANGGSTAFAAATTTVSITVNAVNDAPEITEAGEFADITEDLSPNNGVTVSSFLNGLVADSDNNAVDTGLAITATNVTGLSGSGSDWQYSTNGGTTWNDVGAVSNTSALLLSPAHLIRFNPAVDQSGSGELTYKVWDGSTGTGGAKENLTLGDTDRVSSAAFTSSIAVTAVNDDPVRSGGTKTIEENTSYVLQTADLAYAAKADAPNEQSADQIIYQVTTLAGSGNIQKQYGSTWATLAVGSLFSQSDIDAGDVRYVHTGAELSANATDSFKFTVRDGAGSELTNQSFDLTITNVNAPLSLTNTTISVNEFITAGDVNVINIGTSDADNTDVSLIQFTLKSLPNASLGKLEIDKGSGFVDAAVSDTFTKADLDSGKIRYVHNGTEPVGVNATTTFTVDATDSSSAGINTAGNPSPSTVTDQTITLKIQPINDTPEKVVAVPVIPEGGTLVIDENFIDFTDPDSATTQFTVIIDTVPTKGALFLNGVRLGVGSMLLRSDITSDLLEYRHFDSNPDADTNTIDDTFNYTMRDRDGATITASQGIKITPNDADSAGDTSSGVGANNGGEAVLAEGSTYTITDANLARTNSGANYSVTTLPSTGALQLNGVDLVVGVNDTFTAADITAGNLKYVHNDTENFTDTFTFTADAAAGNVFNFQITPVNEAPIINTPDGTNPITITVTEHDTASTPYSGGQDVSNAENAFLLTTTQLSGSDIDLPADSSLFYELTGKPPGGEIMIWNGTAYESLTKERFTVQDLKDGKVAYFHTAGKEPDTANDKFTIKLTDGGATDSAARTINITVNDSNDAPSTQGNTFTINEGATQDLASILNGKFTDSDAGDTPDNLTLELTAIPNVSAGKIQDYSGGGAGVTLTVGSTFTKADLDAGHIRYEHAGGEFFSDSFAYKAIDDGAPNLESSPDTVNISIRPVNDDPTIGVNLGIVLGDDRYENETFTITSTQLAGADGDHDSTSTASQLKQIQYRVTSNVTSGTLTLNGKVLGAGSVFTQADVNNGLLKYQHTDEANLTDSFDFKISDAGGGNEPTGTFNIALNAVNDSPELVVPKAVTLLEEGVKTITGVVVSDVDAATNDIVTTLAVTKGTITFANTGLGGAVVAGAGGTSLTITGTVTQVNAMLAQGVQYTGSSNQVGADTLSINVNDGGNTGTDPSVVNALVGRTFTDTVDTGGAGDQQASGTVGITLLPLNDAPTIGTFTAAESIIEDASLTLGNLSFADVDVATGNVSVTLKVNTATGDTSPEGKITVNGAVGGVTVSNNTTNTVTVTGTLANINTLLNTAGSITYAAKTNFNGSDTLNVTISDLGNTGAGGAKSASHDVAITITPVNDAPDVSTAVAVSGNEDTDITVKLEAVSLDISGNPNSTITGFTITTLPNAAHGILYKSDGTTLVVKDVFLTKAEAETLVFKPVANSHVDASFVYTAFDGALTSATQTGTITVNAVNDTPTLSVVSTGVTYQEGSGLGVSGTAVDLTTGAVNVTDIELITTDEDSFNGARLEVDRDGSNNSDDVFTIDVASNPTITLSNASNVNSTITVGGDVIGTITNNSNGQIRVTFSALAEQSDVNTVAQAIYYQNSSDSPPASVNLDFRFRDGNAGSAQGSGGIKQVETVVNVAITSANDAPVGKNGTYSSAEDATTPATFTLSEANVLSSDADSASSMPYVAITGNAASANAVTEGVWEYSTNAGGVWTNVGVVTDSSSIVVAAGSLVRFVPVADYNGVPGALSFRAIDNTSADITGTGVDVSTNGGTTAIDGTARTITSTITSVNDAPALAANQLSPTATENGTSTGLVPLLNSTGTAIAATDVDATHFDGGSITVSLDGYLTGDALSLEGTFGAAQGVASTTGGTGSNFVINLNSNATPTQVDAILAAVRFSHTGDNPTDGGNDTTRTYSIKLNDGGQSNGPGNTGTTGTPKDSNILTGTITLVDQNDSPTGTAAALAAIAEDVTNPAGTLLSSLSIFTDKDGNTLAGIAVSGNNADATTEGVWQYQSNGQTMWAPIGTASDAASIVLQANSKVRFVPAANFTGASADSLSIRVLDSTYSGAYSNSAASTVSLTTSGGTGVEAFATAATAISINVTEVNDAPTFSDVGGTVAYTESAVVAGLGTAVLLDTDAKIADIELSGLDNIADNDFGGATLTIERKTTANADDVFAIETGNGVALAGSNIQIGGVTKAVLTTNTGGSMLITFSAGATDANVESIMQQISFANKSDQPPTSAVIEYTFNDKNAGDQGTGLNATGKAEVTVNITATNDTPVATPDTGAVTENSGTTTVVGNAILDATADSDADGDDLDVSDITGPNGAKTDNGATFTIPGTYGSLVINKATGAYTYTIDNTLAATQALDDGDVPVETFNYTVSDGNGGSATSTIKITVNGDNDAPVANPNTDAITEDTATELGNLITDATADTDVDDSDLDISAVTGPGAAAVDSGTVLTIAGNYGTLAITKATGAYTYSLNNANTTVIALGVGESLTETFTYTLTDGDATDTATLTMTINGRNDSPVGSAASLSVVEDTTNPSGTLISSLGIYTDADGDSQNGIAVSANSADAVTEGVWQYSSDAGTTWVPIATATDAASVVLQNTSLIRFVPVANFTGNSADSLSVRVLDNTYAGGYSDSTNTASGTPVTLSTSGGTGVEAFATVATAISINVTEVNDTPVLSDLGGTVAYTESANVAGLGTSVLLDADAKIADIELSGLDNIADNDFDGATLTIERKGTADTDDVFAIEAGKGVSVSGSNIVIASTNVATFTNVGGSMVITFAAGATDANVEAIMQQISFANKSDQPPATAVIEYTFNDKNTGDQGTGLNSTVKAEVTVNITATNDTPVATPDIGAVTENSGTTTVGGNAISDATADSDADGDDLDVTDITGPNGAKTDTDSNTTFTIPGVYGSLVINKETGAYVYTIDNTLAATQALDDGDTPVETFNYTISDGNSASATSTIKITVNGDNDAPVANPNTGEITENSVSISGNLITEATADSDVDDTDLDISAVTRVAAPAGTSSGGNLTLVGNFGTLVINEDTGAYTYTLDNTNATVKGLGVGQTTTELFTYTLSDKTDTDTANLTITIKGQNNVPIARVDTASVTENSGTTTATGNAITDATADSDIDGDDLDISAITGPNGASTDNGTTFSIEGVYGTMVINKETGAYTYTLDNSKSVTQALDDGDAPTEVFNYTINDGQLGTASSTITVTVNGANDAPVATTNTISTTIDDTNVTGNLITDSIADSDVDDTDLDISAVTGANASGSAGGELTIVGDYGTLVINEGSGAYTYTLDKTNTSVTGLGIGQSLTDTFTYTLTDGTDTDTSTLKVTVNLNNVSPVANADSGTLTEDDAISASTGNVFANDSDGDGDDLDVTGASGPNGVATDNGSSIIVPGVYGSLLINKETGAYSYTLDNSKAITQMLDSGDFPTEVFNYAITDGRGGNDSSSITITIAGVNDLPTTSATIPEQANIDGAQSISLDAVSLAGFKDVDDTLTYSATNLPAGLSISATGIISGTIDKSASKGGASGVHTVTVTATDDNGTTKDAVFNWVVTNPLPVASDNSGSVTEDGLAVKGGNLITEGVADTDPDGDTLSIGAVSSPSGTVTDNGTTITVNGTYGTLTVTKANGIYSYALNNANSATNALDLGDSVSEVFTYTLTDSDGGTSSANLVITVNGANDAPTISSALSDVSVAGTSPVSIDVSGSFSDVDADDSITFSAFGLPSGLSIDSSTGLITGTPAAGSANGGANGDGVFSVTVSGTDSNGRLVSDTFDLTIGNTPPVAQPAGFGLTAGGGAITGNASGTDPDGDVIASFNLVSGVSEGSLSFNSDGSFSFDDAGAFDDLAEGATRTVSFTYTVTDANGAVSSPATISFTVTGVENVTVTDPGNGVTDPGNGVVDPGNGVIDPGNGVVIDPGTGVVTDPGTGVVTDPGTGVVTDPGTGVVTDPGTGVVTDPGTGVVTDPGTGVVTDPGTGVVTDPGTGVVTDPGTGVVTDPGTGVVTDPGTGVVTDPGTGVVTDPGTGVIIDPVVPEVVEPPFVDPSGFVVDVPTEGGPATGGAVTGDPGGGSGGGVVVAPVDNPNPTIITQPNLNLGGAANVEIIQLNLTLTLEDQLVTTRGQNLFTLPANAFDNGGVSPISVEVVLADGSALPDYIIFNADDLSFIVDGAAAGEAGAREIIIRVTGSDGSGESASGTFIILIVEADGEGDGQAQPVEGDTVVNDQGSIQLTETGIDVAAVLNEGQVSQEIQHKENEAQSTPSFFDKLDVAANEDNFENKVKQLLDDIVDLIS